MLVKNELTGESIKVKSADEAFDAFCELATPDDCANCPVCEEAYDETDVDIEDVAQQVIDTEEDYKDAQKFYTLITETRNDLINLTSKLAEIAEYQRDLVAEKYENLQEVSEFFNEVYENSCDECEECQIPSTAELEKCEKTPENEVEKCDGGISVKAEADDNFLKVEIKSNSPITPEMWHKVINDLEKEFKKD